jgi:hypothetical protein
LVRLTVAVPDDDGVPLVVPLPEASRHLLPYTINCLLDV